MKNRWKIGDCAVDITPATKKYKAVWFVTRGEHQKDGIADLTSDARRAAREAAQKLGCRPSRKRRSR